MGSDGRPIIGMTLIQISELVSSIEPKALLIRPMPGHRGLVFMDRWEDLILSKKPLVRLPKIFMPWKQVCPVTRQ